PRVLKRPALGVDHSPGLMFLGRNVPQLFDAEAENLRSAVLAEGKNVGQPLGQMTARAFGEESIARVKLDAGLVVGPVTAVTGTVSGVPLSFQSGISSLSATGSTTAPERICAPTSLPFSRMHTESSRPAAVASCLRRMPALSPAGPAPTMTTSYCMESRCMVLSSRDQR